MELESHFGSIDELWLKMAREAHRAFHESDPTYQADHFFNFCVTAHAMRDYFYEHRGIAACGAKKKEYREVWDQEPLLKAARDIANTSKHFRLRDRKTGEPRQAETGAARQTESPVVDIFSASSGELFRVARDAPDIIVELSDGTSHQLCAFTGGLLDYWRDYLEAHGILVRVDAEDLSP